MVPSPSHLSRRPRRPRRPRGPTHLRTQAGLVAHPQIHIFALPHYLLPQPRNPEVSPMDPRINLLNPEASVASRYKTDTNLASHPPETPRLLEFPRNHFRDHRNLRRRRSHVDGMIFSLHCFFAS